jgi:hypothetical protein
MNCRVINYLNQSLVFARLNDFGFLWNSSANHTAAAAALGRVKSDGFGLSVCLLRRCQFIEIRDGD